MPTATIDALGAQGFQFGISSWTRLTAVGGDTGNATRDANGRTVRRHSAAKAGWIRAPICSAPSRPKLSFYASFDAGSGIRNGEPFGQTASSSFRKAYLDYDAGSLLRGLNVRLGRQEYWMGPGHFGTGVLSDAAGGLDSLSTSFRRGSYELRGIYARLGTGPAGSPRSLYVQDANVRIGKNAQNRHQHGGAFAQRQLQRRQLPDGVVSPLPLYVIRRDKTSARSANANSNAIVSAYGELGVAAGVRVYGEAIFDDIGVNNRNPIENRAGSIFGFKVNNAKDPAKSRHQL